MPPGAGNFPKTSKPELSMITNTKTDPEIERLQDELAELRYILMAIRSTVNISDSESLSGAIHRLLAIKALLSNTEPCITDLN